ncbi:hypothetical protein PENFLA_c022G05219 [Penicillium flavigenum]|uniref:Uncharacterized protein n=1 Tax=Penicillium flavigenum TaxID=254877 RepID=A0A1V6SX21_9EURO|nr:hypothetical protein PENFLA_c022G05219 [Penicillium flavigenum]
MQSTPTSLWRALEDGSEEPIDVADLYRYQRYRWLSGESEKLAMPYRKFNLQALLNTSVKAAGNDEISST